MKNKKIVIPFIFIAIISFLIYLYFEYKGNGIKELNSIITLGICLLFIICFIIISCKNQNEKATPFIIIGFLLITGFSIYKILDLKNHEELYVKNFYNEKITLANNYFKDKNIDIEEIYEYSDIIPEYHIISQNISSDTLLKDINKITLIISLGPDYSKEVIVPSFIGWKYEEVITYLENNFLNNIEFNFVESTSNPNTVINQDGSGTRKRNDLIKLTFARDILKPINIIDFKNKTLLYATSWLKKNGFKYELIYEYNDEINKDHVISQDVINEVKDPETDTITITISKGKMIKVPDFTKMNKEEINKFLIENNIKVNYIETYDEEIAMGDIIEASNTINEVIESGSTITLTISKGKVTMPEITNITLFETWAKENNILYDIIYENSETVKKDNIISTSHKTGDVIKKDDKIVIKISSGKSITVPNFVNMSKTDIQNKCNSLNLTCSFKYDGYKDKIKKDICVSQSKKSGTNVTEGANVIIYLSSGIQEKVNVPSFSSQTKSNIESKCKSLGITCNFNYQSSYSDKAKDTCVSQSKTGTINKGSTITITLSKGPAETHTIVIDANLLSSGNPTKTKETLSKKLSSACPNVKFTYVFQTANSGIGYLASNSEVKVGSNKLTDGKTYKVIINSN